MILKQGDLISWAWKDEGDRERFEPYWCKSRTAIVLADGRWVDTYWHVLRDTEHLWDSEYEVPKARVSVDFLINVADLAPLRGPREQYAKEDSFYLCDGGGGCWREYQRKDAKPQHDRVRAVLIGRLAHAQSELSAAQQRIVHIERQISEHDAGVVVVL